MDFVSRHKRQFLSLSLWVIIFVVARGIMAANQLSLNELFDQAILLLKTSWFGVFLFIGFYVARPLLLIPGTILNLTAGMVYGLFPGILVSVVASYISGTVTYIVARWFMVKTPDAEGRLGQLMNFMRRNPFEAVASIQLMYISLDITSSLAGILHLPFRHFIMGVIVGGTIPNAMGVMMGSSIEGSLENGTLQIRPEMLVNSIIVLILTLNVSAYLRRRNNLR